MQQADIVLRSHVRSVSQRTFQEAISPATAANHAPVVRPRGQLRLPTAALSRTLRLRGGAAPLKATRAETEVARMGSRVRAETAGRDEEGGVVIGGEEEGGGGERGEEGGDGRRGGQEAVGEDDVVVVDAHNPVVGEEAGEGRMGEDGSVLIETHNMAVSKPYTPYPTLCTLQPTPPNINS